MQKINKYLANALASVISWALLAPMVLAQGGYSDFPNITPVTTTDLVDVIGRIISWLFGLSGALAVVFLVYGGIQYIVGGPKGEEAAKKIILNAIIGLIVIAMSYVIANFAVDMITGYYTS